MRLVTDLVATGGSLALLVALLSVSAACMNVVAITSISRASSGGGGRLAMRRTGDVTGVAGGGGCCGAGGAGEGGEGTRGNGGRATSGGGGGGRGRAGWR